MFEAALTIDTASTVERENEVVSQLRRGHRDRVGREDAMIDFELSLLTQMWRRVVTRRQA